MMKIRLFQIVFVFVVVLTLMYVFSCAKDKTPRPVEPCDPGKVYFNRDIMPLLASNCAKSGCHDAISKTDGVNLSNYEGVLQQVKAGNPEGSDLFEVITDSDEKDRMPPQPNTPLTADQIDLIRKWISEGALNLTCAEDTSSCDLVAVTFQNDVSTIINTNCAGCHGSANPSGGIILTNHSGVENVAASGKLYNAISQNGAAAAMPVGGKLSDCEIKTIKAWIDGGRLNN